MGFFVSHTSFEEESEVNFKLNLNEKLKLIH
jgi:hypothetical protein